MKVLLLRPQVTHQREQLIVPIVCVVTYCLFVECVLIMWGFEGTLLVASAPVLSLSAGNPASTAIVLSWTKPKFAGDAIAPTDCVFKNWIILWGSSVGSAGGTTGQSPTSGTCATATAALKNVATTTCTVTNLKALETYSFTVNEVCINNAAAAPTTQSLTEQSLQTQCHGVFPIPHSNLQKYNRLELNHQQN